VAVVVVGDSSVPAGVVGASPEQPARLIVRAVPKVASHFFIEV